MSKRGTDLFVEVHGEGPHACYGCGEDVIIRAGDDDGIVHHVDHVGDNDVIENLAPMHRSCHTRLHLAGKPKSEEHVRKMSEQRKGMTPWNAGVSIGEPWNKGVSTGPQPHSEAHVAARRATRYPHTQGLLTKKECVRLLRLLGRRASMGNASVEELNAQLDRTLADLVQFAPSPDAMVASVDTPVT